MTVPASNQRFCPVCNRAFVANEAVLRCEGCEVMHHPGCWVTNNGCATQEPHKVAPAAMAYKLPPLSIAGEGRPPLAFEPRPRSDSPDVLAPVVGSPGATPVIGATGARPTGPKRYVGSTSERSSSVKPMPSIYNRHKVLGYWYVPAAVLVAALVAIGVIWAAEQFRGGDDSSVGVAPVASSVAPAATTVGSTPAPGSTPGATAAASGTPRAGARFKAGDSVTVAGTGDCLNVRSGPARSNDVMICLADGTALTISDGPQTADGFTWWKVKTTVGEGWVAEDFLARKP